MSSPDRSKMAAGLSALLGGSPDASAPSPRPSRPPKSASKVEAATSKPPKKQASRPERRETPKGAPADQADADGGTHARTSTGYTRESGEQVYRVSLFLTKGERRTLREQAEDAGMSLTDYVKARTGL